jgi:RNA recognition motif-containing protein
LFDIRRNREYMNIYVGNLAMETTGDELKQTFSVFGKVKYVIVMHDGNTNRYEAGLYGYIEMTMKSEGLAAINSLNGTIIKGRVINTIEALPLTAKKIQMPLRRCQDRPVKVSKWHLMHSPQLHKN